MKNLLDAMEPRHLYINSINNSTMEIQNIRKRNGQYHHILTGTAAFYVELLEKTYSYKHI